MLKGRRELWLHQVVTRHVHQDVEEMAVDRVDDLRRRVDQVRLRDIHLELAQTQQNVGIVEDGKRVVLLHRRLEAVESAAQSRGARRRKSERGCARATSTSEHARTRYSRSASRASRHTSG